MHMSGQVKHVSPGQNLPPSQTRSSPQRWPCGPLDSGCWNSVERGVPSPCLHICVSHPHPGEGPMLASCPPRVNALLMVDALVLLCFLFLVLKSPWRHTSGWCVTCSARVTRNSIKRKDQEAMTSKQETTVRYLSVLKIAFLIHFEFLHCRGLGKLTVLVVVAEPSGPCDLRSVASLHLGLLPGTLLDCGRCVQSARRCLAAAGTVTVGAETLACGARPQPWSLPADRWHLGDSREVILAFSEVITALLGEPWWEWSQGGFGSHAWTGLALTFRNPPCKGSPLSSASWHQGLACCDPYIHSIWSDSCHLGAYR